jgi:hypothetical protein
MFSWKLSGAGADARCLELTTAALADSGIPPTLQKQEYIFSFSYGQDGAVNFDLAAGTARGKKKSEQFGQVSMTKAGSMQAAVRACYLACLSHQPAVTKLPTAV